MAKGDIAKRTVEDIIKTAFGDKYVGTVDKKIYVRADDGGDMVQIAIALTCPKNPIGTPTLNGGTAFDHMVSNEVECGRDVAEISNEEIENVKTLMAKLGL